MSDTTQDTDFTEGDETRFKVVTRTHRSADRQSAGCRQRGDTVTLATASAVGNGTAITFTVTTTE